MLLSHGSGKEEHTAFYRKILAFLGENIRILG
jgi:hypothetical protein